MDQIRAVVLIVLDSVGIGDAPDVAEFGDEGSATLPNIAKAVGGIRLPNLEKLGLGRITRIDGVSGEVVAEGAYGSMTEKAAGKDTTTGHWEIAGVILKRPFPLYPKGFPLEIIKEFEARIGSETLGNYPASGTEIIAELGEEHLETGKPIVYTSGDSVFQIAAHIDVIPLDRLYEICKIARELLRGPHEVGRVIARPFKGKPGAFERTPDRHDYSVLPPRDTILDELVAAGLEMRGVGKISDIFGGRGLTSSRPTRSNDEGITTVVEEVAAIDRGLVFANLVDFDSSFGHRNDPEGYAGALEAFDLRLPEILESLGQNDVALITADHGNDPTTPSTDHSRERVPLLCVGPRVEAGLDLGVRASFSDCAATIAELLEVETSTPGRSFGKVILST
jgi:phosphopentomutase